MDTFIVEVPAHDDGIPGHGGCMMAQVYGGLDSELLSVHPMSSKSALGCTKKIELGESKKSFGRSEIIG